MVALPDKADICWLRAWRQNILETVALQYMYICTKVKSDEDTMFIASLSRTPSRQYNDNKKSTRIAHSASAANFNYQH